MIPENYKFITLFQWPDLDNIKKIFTASETSYESDSFLSREYETEI